MKTKFLVLAVFILASMAGCSTISKTDCLNIDWYQLGFDNGENGLGPSAASEVLESCSNHDVEIDIAAYNQGQEKGKELFCQTDNAFELGKQGYQYSVACSPEFRGEYAIGYDFYLVIDAINQVEQALISNEASITNLESGISSARARMSSGRLSDRERNELRQSIDSMQSQVVAAQASTHKLEPLVHELQQELQSLESRHGR